MKQVHVLLRCQSVNDDDGGERALFCVPRACARRACMCMVRVR
jgi:hypothetical protein